MQSASMNVYENLAIEEQLLETFDGEPILFIWRSDAAVVIGKNQIPWRECNMKLLAERKIPLARRISGGGTVFHDRGNLNCCLITQRADFTAEQLFDLFDELLAIYGLKAARGEGHSLFCGKRKISGSAFCMKRNAVLHHATLLVDADLDAMHGLLQQDNRIESRAVGSKPASVVNLNSLNSSVTVSELTLHLTQLFERQYGAVEKKCTKAVNERVLELASSQWLLERSPAFSYVSGRGAVEVKAGMVKSLLTNGCQTALSAPFLFSPEKVKRLLEL